MKRHEANRNTESVSTGPLELTHGARFSKVVNGRKQPVRGLWIRGERYYAQLSFEDPLTGVKRVRRVPLVTQEGNPVATVAQAEAELNRLKVQRSDNNLPVLKRTPMLSEYVPNYIKAISSGDGRKKASSIGKEKSLLSGWVAHIGHLRLDQIKRAHVNSHVERLLASGMKARTANLAVIALRCILKRARDDGWIQRLPMEGMRPLKVPTKQRDLVTTASLERLCKAALASRVHGGKRVPITRNGRQLADYLKFMALTGARRNESLAVRWRDVLWDQRQLVIGAEGDTKNHEARIVDFNPALEAHLKSMQKRRPPDSEWLFPSPQRGAKDIPTRTFRESLELAKARANMPGFGFHDCRHHFISHAVMSGIDFMTIARWVGHRDGGVLIGKVYGHLADTHRRAMAAKLDFISKGSK